MAYLAELSSLTDELVALITSASRSDPKFNIYREASLRHLRHHSNLRTNQFEVQDQLTGWQERFRVHSREALADALRTRLDALESHTNRWTPDTLHFLLLLADQPTQKTELSDLDSLRKPEQEPGRNLTWAEIAREDGWLDDRAIWQRIDYAGSSDDDGEGAYEETRSETSTETASTSPSSTDKYQRTFEDLIVEEDGDVELQNVLDSQAWRHADPPRPDTGRRQKTPISDLQVFREVLFMLGGHPTTLFGPDGDLVPDYQLPNVAWDSFKALMTTCAEWGRTLRPLRDFSAAKQPIPLVQVFQDAVAKRLLVFDRQLSDIQARYVAPKHDVVVSLMQVMAELRRAFADLSALSSIVQQICQGRYIHPFLYLELLFEAAGVAQSVGDLGVYQFLGTIFFDCFQVYLRPIRSWMEDGRLYESNKTFFIAQSPTKTALKDIWNGQFKLRQTQAGVLHVPNFLHPAVRKIFTTGKSVNVLKHLGRYESAKKLWTTKEPTLDFATVCPDDLELCPFADLFSDAFDLWIQSKHHATSATLRQALYESCNLSSALDSLQHIYFAADASALEGFADPLFHHLDTLSPGWKDRFTLTETAQEAFSRYIDPYRLSAHVDPRGLARSAAASRSSVRASLPAVRLTYRLDWPVQILLSDASLAAYQTIFTFLLQLHRGRSILQRQWLSRSSAVATATGPVLHHYGLYCLVRAKLLWFCNTLATYLATLVLAPNAAAMRARLGDAVDVDDMIAVHAAFAATTLEESCLGPKLEPLRDCVLDLLDLAVRLDDVHRAELAREAREQRELSRLSPVKPRGPPKPAGSRTGVYVKPEEKEDGGGDGDGDGEGANADADDVPDRSGTRGYGDALRALADEFEKHLRFVSGGLRAVARATRVPAAAKWDILAEMLEVGVDEAKGKGGY